MMRRILFFCLIATLAGLSGEADAKPWLIDYQHSTLGFTGMQGSSAFEGSFKNFKADVDFDPDHPDKGKISATIDIAGVTTGDSQRDSTLPQADWFDTAKFPQAEFVSTKIGSTGVNSYEAQGTLTIKGISKAITLPFTLSKEGNHWRARGKTTIVRTDFRIGEGQWADNKTVKLAVEVTLDLTARPQL
jgi:polyisoprenoid-binding protein YceI